MRETATLLRIGVLAAGILGSASSVSACDKQAKATESSCCATSKAAIAPACAAPGAAGSAATTETVPATAPAPAQAGMRAYIDPETGTLGGPGPLPPPSDEAVKALGPETLEEPVETVLPDGSVMLDLKGRGQEYSIMQLDADGQRVVRCVENPNTALQTPPKVEREER